MAPSGDQSGRDAEPRAPAAAPLRALMVGPLPPPVGGMTVVMDNLSTALAQRCDLRVLNNAKTTPPGRPLLRGVAAQLRLLGGLAWTLVTWRPAVVHIHTCSWFTFWRSAVDVVLARVLGARVVLHVHGAEFHKFLASLGRTGRPAARLVFRATSRVIVLGTDWMRLLEPWCPGERLVIVPNGVPVPATVPERDRGAREILSVANYERRKGLGDLIDAAAALPQRERLRLTLLGAETESGHRRELEARAEASGLDGAVEIPGPVIGEAKQPYYDRAAVFCLPSYDEGLPMSMLEAMAQGLPVVCTRVGAIAEAVDDGEQGLLVPPGDVSGLAEALQGLLSDPDRRRTMGAAARERVQHQFSLDAQAAQVLAIYAQLAGRADPGHGVREHA